MGNGTDAQGAIFEQFSRKRDPFPRNVFVDGETCRLFEEFANILRTESSNFGEFPEIDLRFEMGVNEIDEAVHLPRRKRARFALGWRSGGPSM